MQYSKAKRKPLAIFSQTIVVVTVIQDVFDKSSYITGNKVTPIHTLRMNLINYTG